MDTTRIPIARVLELGVRVSWREAVAIILQASAVLAEGRMRGLQRPRIDTLSCVLTRGGDVEFTETAKRPQAEALTLLFRELLADSDPPREILNLARSGTDEHLADDLELLASPTKRRRVEIASVAIRGLAAEAELARRTVDAFRGLPVEANAPLVPNHEGQLVPAESQDAEFNRLRAQVGITPVERPGPSRWTLVVLGVVGIAGLVLGGALMLYGLPGALSPPASPSTPSAGRPVPLTQAITQPASQTVTATRAVHRAPLPSDDALPAALPSPDRAPERIEAASHPAAPGQTPAAAEPPIYSWTSAGITPPALRSPGVPDAVVVTTADPVLDPHFELLIDQAGTVESVRLLARDDRSEAYVRLRMMVAAAKAWHFAPAQLNGHPVRCLARVILRP